MGYYEFTLTAPEESKDAITNKMTEMGCLGFSESGGRIVAYFKDGHNVVTLRDELKSFGKVLEQSGLDPAFSFDYIYLSERDWNESWKKRFVPIDVGENLSILPPWEAKDSSRINLIIDPGMAFGTGHHETTKTCLMLMEKYSRESSNHPSPPFSKGRMGGLRFLDVGAGTGILSIAASRLGFFDVIGVDIDPLAIDAARRNVLLNDLRNIEIKEGGIEKSEGPFDMIAANLMSEVLINIAPDIASRLNKRGIVILSGMLVGQEDEVIKAMENTGLRTIEKCVDGRWVSLVLSGV